MAMSPAAKTSSTPRERARVQTVEDIKRIARDQLATVGSAGLSLRAVARELGIVSSAIYRYVPSRDELLTMLIEDSYNSLGAAAETADRRQRRADHGKRWMAIARAVRRWALDHSAEYGLLYGSPVPGYAAPRERTVSPGSRVSLLVVRLVADAAGAGALDDPPGPPVPAAVHRDLAAIPVDAELSDAVGARLLLAWTAVFGLVSFEVFGQYNGVISARESYFDHEAARLGQLLGLTIP